MADDVIDVQARFNDENDGQNNRPNHSGNPHHTNGSPHQKQPDMDSLKTWGWISYGLHLVVAVAAVLPSLQVGIGLLLIAMLIDWVNRPDARGTWQESHYNWRIHSVLGAGIAYVVTAPLWLAFIAPGLIAWSLISLWLLYRIVRGIVCMREGREVTG